jgi:5-hydroxyisourate hydrolase-like protein (transthyretin family)
VNRWRCWALAGAVLPAIVGCDPCFGVYQCETEPRIAVEGELIVHWDGAPVAGVEIDFFRTGGIDLPVDTVRTMTNREGRFRVVVPTDGPGTVEGAIEVRPPGFSGYRVDGLVFETTRTRGDGSILPPWVVDPYFPYVGELFSRRTGQPMASAAVEFRRTGGVSLYGNLESDGTVRTRTDDAGRFLLLEFVYPQEPGEVVGDLRVEPAAGGAAFSIPGIRLESTHVAYHPLRLARWGIGPSLRYVGELYFRAGRVPAAGVEVEFLRVGGIEASPETFTAVTGADGRFEFPLVAARDGELIGELRIRPPPPYAPELVTGVRVPTFDGDEVRLLGVWGVGFSFNYVGELLWSDTFRPAQGIEVEFRRRGGVEVEPETFMATTDAAGRFALMPRPLAEGEVIFDLHVHPSEQGPSVTIPGVRMTTTYADDAALLGVWLVPPS